MPINQAHEQENAYIKGFSAEKPTSFKPWVLSGLELARLQR